MTSNFAKQVASIEAGLQEPVIQVGNLDAVRDFTDVRDMVRAYWLAADKGKPGEVYNIATGSGITIRAHARHADRRWRRSRSRWRPTRRACGPRTSRC